ILFICTGTFPDVFHSDLPLLYPQKILHSVIPHMTKSGKIGVIIPAKEQIQQTVQKWGEAGLDATVAAYSPYDMSDEISQTVQEFHEKKLDLIVMDCIGYTSWMKNEVARKTGKPVVLARTFVARVLGELLNH
ncbi:MAG: AroM family protein, partial [Firmicutes bacterium]|nr:AroM family protein [Bacillota bacterium]